jgi:hypothetical protein
MLTRTKQNGATITLERKRRSAYCATVSNNKVQMKKTTTIYLLSIISFLISCKMFKDTEGVDSLKSKYNVDNLVFRTNSKFTYSTYRIKGNDTLDCYIIYLNDTVVVKSAVLTILPGKFFKQTKMKWEYLDEKGKKYRPSISGLVEDKSGIWIHPPRTGIPFIYAESAPFPEIKFPIQINDSWKSSLIGLKGYESIGLEGKVTFESLITETKNIQTELQVFENCWVIDSKGESIIGSSTHRYFFDNKYGFVFSEYCFPTGEKLILTLSDYKPG